MHIIPTTVTDAFAKGDILQVVFISILFGFGLSSAGPRAKPIVALLESLTHVVFRVVNILMIFAPIGAFGAMAFTIGKYGFASLGTVGQIDCHFLGDLDSVCADRSRRGRRAGRIQHC